MVSHEFAELSESAVARSARGLYIAWRTRLLCCVLLCCVFVCVCACVRVGSREWDSLFSATGLSCLCSRPFCDTSNHCNVTGAGFCVVTLHTYQDGPRFEYGCADPSISLIYHLLCRRTVGHCFFDAEWELGCFCCRSDNCNTKWFYYQEQERLFGPQSSSIPLPTPVPSSVPTGPPTPTPGK